MIHSYRTGTGPPVLLLHGIPETHRMWRRVAPLLAEHSPVVATDLRGFGRSGVPDGGPHFVRELITFRSGTAHPAAAASPTP